MKLDPYAQRSEHIQRLAELAGGFASFQFGNEPLCGIRNHSEVGLGESLRLTRLTNACPDLLARFHIKYYRTVMNRP